MAHNSSREVLGGLVYQGVDEGVYYSLNTTPWGGTPTSITHDVYLESDTDKTSLKATLMAGTPSASVDVITLPKFSGGTLGEVYVIEINFTNAGSQELQAYIRVKIE